MCHDEDYESAIPARQEKKARQLPRAKACHIFFFNIADAREEPFDRCPQSLTADWDGRYIFEQKDARRARFDKAFLFRLSLHEASSNTRRYCSHSASMMTSARLDALLFESDIEGISFQVMLSSPRHPPCRFSPPFRRFSLPSSTPNLPLPASLPAHHTITDIIFSNARYNAESPVSAHTYYLDSFTVSLYRMDTEDDEFARQFDWSIYRDAKLI